MHPGLGGAQKCREFYNLLWFLLDWIPVFWQKAVFWIPPVIGGIHSAKITGGSQIIELLWGGTYSSTGYLCYQGHSWVPLTLDSLLINVCLFFDVVSDCCSVGCLISIFCTLFSMLAQDCLIGDCIQQLGLFCWTFCANL